MPSRDDDGLFGASERSPANSTRRAIQPPERDEPREALVANRLGRAAVMILAMLVAIASVGATLCLPLPAVVLGIAPVMVGFFAGHGVASGTVGRLAGSNKAQAASLY